MKENGKKKISAEKVQEQLEENNSEMDVKMSGFKKCIKDKEEREKLTMCKYLYRNACHACFFNLI